MAWSEETSERGHPALIVKRQKYIHMSRLHLRYSRFPKRRFDHIHVDLFGTLPQSDGKRYIFTIVDRFTCWPEAIPLSDASTELCAQALINQWITRFELPSEISSDRGSQFTSKLWSVITQLLEIKNSRTTTA